MMYAIKVLCLAVLSALMPGCSGCTVAGNPGGTSAGAGSTSGSPDAIYYVNCSLASDGSGSQSSPWNSLNDVNAHTFLPGDSILLARGTSCNGMLAPQGSGAKGSPIQIDAYGTGALPIIHAGASNNQAVYLNNQQYWTIADLEIVGGVNYGIHVTGNLANQPLSGITLQNLNVHSATGVSTARSDSGEVYLEANGVGQTLNDIVINGVNAHDSKVAEGIIVKAGGGWTGGSSQPLGNNITVQNSTAYNIYGDGILISELTNGLLQNNVAHDTGLCPNCGSTPSGLWEWLCHSCIVQNNESYNNHTWGGDGGDFDIDFYNNENIVQYNYGHDSAGYCIAVFGAENTSDDNNIIRYNICSNNERDASHPLQGDIFLSTWNGGSLNGIQIYNNSFYWNPVNRQPLLYASKATFVGSNPDFFKNNAIYSTVPDMVSASSPLTLDSNIYYVVSGTPTWTWKGVTYTSLATYQSASGQDNHSLVTDPMLNTPTSNAVGRPTTAFTLQTGSPATGTGVDVCAGISNCTMGTQDFFGNMLPAHGTGLNIGAYQ